MTFDPRDDDDLQIGASIDEPRRSRRQLLQAAAVAASAAVAVPVIIGSGGCKPVLDRLPSARGSAKGGSPRVATAVPVSELVMRRAGERGAMDYGWLKARYSFSFGRYRDPKYDAFRALRVLNEDRIDAKKGFPLHPHRNMEIVTYVLDGALRHRDTLGNGGVIRPGEVQRMSAGSGIWHSEFNPSQSNKVHLLQIWIRPDRDGHKPGYQQRIIGSASRDQPVRLIAGPSGRDGAVRINADARIYACNLQRGQQMTFEVKRRRHVWIQIARGRASINGARVERGDGVAISRAGQLAFQADRASELLIFDLA